RVEELGEELNDGSQVFLQYNLKIDSKNNRASLSMTTWHAGITRPTILSARRLSLRYYWLRRWYRTARLCRIVPALFLTAMKIQ
ncbi:hypothetical protein MJI95_39460, partial [Salmonella enterica subsp. enterica serovar Kentucky]|nr:hypothetical protein [Salmonella enterica subsp. enterica serovar Kentucky]